MPEINAKVWKLLEVGSAVRMLYGDGNPNNEIRHIRATVDDEWIVYRVWSKSRQGWRYCIDWVYAFQLAWSNGKLTPAG